MKSFHFHNPTEIAFGPEAIQDLVGLIQQNGGSRVLLVYGAESVEKSGLLSKAQSLLEHEGIVCSGFGGARPNPLLSHAEEGVKKAVAFGADFILAIGGGSAIDTAKGIALGAANPGKALWTLWNGGCPFEAVVPLGVVLTIPAAGSEMSNLAVLTNDTLCSKRVFGTPQFRPRFAVMNPAYCATLPSYHVGCGVADILMHTLERYFSPVLGNALTDEMAEGLMRTVIRYGVAAVKDPGNEEAMSELMWCGSLSNSDLTGVGGIPDFSTHELGHELSAQYGVAHGASMAVMWGAWARHCQAANPARFVRYARQVWGIDAVNTEQIILAGIEKTEIYFSALGMPVCFSEVEGMGILGANGIEALTNGCLHGGERSTIGAFKKLNRMDITRIYEAANH